MQELERVAAEVRECVRCSLGLFRNRAVAGRGDPAAALVLIGEAPGAQEDLEGTPFCGPAGQLLDSLLGVARIEASRCYVTNVVKCRPRGNELPGPSQLAACSGYLDAQVSALKPKAAVLLGRCAVSAVTGAVGPIEDLCSGGPLQTRWGIPAWAAYHPSFLLRARSDRGDGDFGRLVAFEVGALRAAGRQAGVLVGI